MRAALARLQTGVSNTYQSAYEDAMRRIEGQVADHAELAKQVLCWICFAQRPLTTIELQHALAVELGAQSFDEDNIPEIEDILSACIGLVIIDEQSDVIRLVHYTTQEYFQQTHEQWFPDAERSIFDICSTYLLFDEFKRGACASMSYLGKRLEEYPLLYYAANNWDYHAREASISSQEFSDFLDDHSVVQSLEQVLGATRKEDPKYLYYSGPDRSTHYAKETTHLILAAKFGALAWITTLLDSDNEMDTLNNVDSFDLSALAHAVHNSHSSAVRVLLHRGASCGIMDIKNSTPLHAACQIGNLDIVGQLLDNGADCEAEDDDGCTPLIIAVRWGHTPVVEILLAHNANINKSDLSGTSPLIEAIQYGRDSLINILVRQGADCNAVTEDGVTPISCAAMHGHTDTIQLLLDNGADCNPPIPGSTFRHYHPLLCALMSEDTTTVEVLLKHGANGNMTMGPGWTLLILASRDGKADIVTTLLKHGLDPFVKDDEGYSALVHAVWTGNISTVNALLEHDTEYLVKDGAVDTALIYAASNGSVHVVNALLKHGANYLGRDEMGRSPLMHAARNGYAPMVRILIGKGVDFKAKCLDGATPFGEAVKHGHAAVVALLLEKGGECEVPLPTNATRKRVHFEVKGGYVDLIKLLLEHEVDLEHEPPTAINHGDEMSAAEDSICFRHMQSGLEVTMRLGHLETAQLFLDRGANINAKCADDSTFLHWAVTDNDISSAEFLLKNGADCGAVDSQGRSCVRLAFELGVLQEAANKKDDIFYIE